MATILITGISGLLGTVLAKHLQATGHTIKGLGRKSSTQNGIQIYKWDIDAGEIDERAFTDIDYLIHLAGAGIADKPWTLERQREIIESRTKGMELLTKKLLRQPNTLKAFIGASAIGAYGLKTRQQPYTETERETDDFFGKTCQLWEDSYTPFQHAGIRTVITRIGVVLAKEGGAYIKMKGPFRFGLGSPLGSGKQYMPYIHINDVVAAMDWALFNEHVNGTYNLVGSEHVTNAAFSKALAKSLNKPFFMPAVPTFILKLILGDMHQMVTEGSPVSNAKLIHAGFKLKFPNLEAALTDLAH